MTDQHPLAPVPSRLFEDDAAEQRWRGRFTAPRTSIPQPARDEPNRTVYVSNASGTFELVTWDLVTGSTVQATDRSDGTSLGTLSADGRSLWFFDDTDGDEFGRWRHQPFGDGPGPGEEALPGVAPGYPAGIAVGRTLAMAGLADDDGSRIHLANSTGVHTVYRHANDAGLDAVSTDETIWVLSHSEHGDSRYPALRAYAVESGDVLCELDDTPGKGLVALEFSPVSGDQRVLVGHERHGRDELGLWDVATGTFTEVPLDLPGDLDATFTEDAAALVVVSTHQGRCTAYRYDLASAVLTPLPLAGGVISGVVTRPDGALWYKHSSAAEPASVKVIPAQEASPETLPMPAAAGAPAPSEPVTDIWVTGRGGDIHALLARPNGAAVADADHSNRALPTVFMIHGGPAAADEDSFDALRATYLDAGIAVCQVNYRGSTGYGSAWRDALAERVGHTELADIAAVYDHLVIHGMVDPDRCAIAGHSWGGFLALLALGAQPTRWACGVAGVPVADYVAAYADEMEPMRAYDRSLFGGSPDDVPDAYADSSPISYASAVTAPVLIMAGDHDPRCPIRQIEQYLDSLADRDKDYSVYRFNAGHGSMVVDERIRQAALEVAFVRDHLSLPPPRVARDAA